MKNEFKRLIKGTMAENFIDALKTTDDGLSYSWNGFVNCEVVFKDERFYDLFDCDIRKMNNGEIGKVWEAQRDFDTLKDLVKVLIDDAKHANAGSRG